MKAPATLSQPVKHKRIGPNDPCPCNSGKKYKKCHMRPPVYIPPDSKPVTVEPQLTVDPDVGRWYTMAAMRKRKMPERIIWAYMLTGLMVTDDNRKYHEPADLEKWDDALFKYDTGSDEYRKHRLPIKEMPEGFNELRDKPIASVSDSAAPPASEGTNAGG